MDLHLLSDEEINIFLLFLDRGHNTSDLNETVVEHLYRNAMLNKVNLFFLELMHKKGWRLFENELNRLRTHYRKAVSLIELLADLFAQLGVHYSFFKTLKPHPFTPADVDVLIPSKHDFARVHKALKMNGFRVLAKDAYGVTLLRENCTLNVDLYSHPSVSNLVYINGGLLSEHIISAKFEGINVQVLDPIGEITIVASHAFYKEQMYTLSDHLTISNLLLRIQPIELLVFAKKAKVRFAVSTALSLSDTIQKATHHLMPHLEEALSALAKEGFPMYRPRCPPLKMPHHYPLTVVARGLFEKVTSERLARSTLPSALRQALFVKGPLALLKHRTRASY